MPIEFNYFATGSVFNYSGSNAAYKSGKYWGYSFWIAKGKEEEIDEDYEL